MPDINPFTFHGLVLWCLIWGGTIYGLSWLLGSALIALGEQ